MMAITRKTIKIEVISGISASVIVDFTFLDNHLYKICTKTVTQVAIIRDIQNQQVPWDLLSGDWDGFPDLELLNGS